MKVSEVPIQDYQDYHTYIQQLFRVRQTRNASYSLRCFARDLGLAPSTMSGLLKQQQGLSEKKAVQVASRLKLSEIEARYFINLTKQERFGPARGVGKSSKKASQAEAQEISGQLNHDRFELQSQLLRDEWLTVIKEWYHVAIVELTKVKGFENDVGWIARRLGIREMDVEPAIARLKRIGLLSEREGTLAPSVEVATTSQGIPSEAICNLHRQIFRLTENSLTRHPPSVRDNSVMVFAMRQADFDACRDRLQVFRRDLVKDMEQEEGPDALYCLSVNLFPLGNDISSSDIGSSATT